MNLPKPGPSYDANNEAQTRSILEQADANNQKRNSDFVVSKNRLLLTSPNGTQWSGTISNAGTVTWTAI